MQRRSLILEKKMFAHTITPSSINIVSGGKVFTIDKTHVNYAAIRDLLQQYSLGAPGTLWRTRTEAKIVELADIRRFIAKATFGAVQISDDAVLFNGQEVKGVIADRLVSLVREGFSPRPLALFLEKLQSNPSKNARDELYLWLETSNLPICEDGDFLAFKKVKHDYTSLHDGVTRNDVGTLLEMRREDVDPDRDNTCSRGYHFCSLNYLTTMCAGRTVICKINPADVVTIPSDYSNQKGRAWRYLIVDEVAEGVAPETYHADTPVVQAEVGMVGVGMSDKYMIMEDYEEEGDDAYEPYDEDDEPYADSIEDELPVDMRRTYILSDDEKTFVRGLFSEAESGWYRLREIKDVVSGALKPSAVNRLFVWSETPQSVNYWDAVSHQMTLDADAKSILTAWIAYWEELQSPENWVWTDTEKQTVSEEVIDTLLDTPPSPYRDNDQRLVFHGDRTFLLADLKESLKEHGQRGTARLYGVPRSTLQEWIKRFDLG